MLEIGFAFLATAAAAYLYGPWLAGLMGIVTDHGGLFSASERAVLPLLGAE